MDIKKLLITGVSGMLGKSLIYENNRRNYNIYGIYNRNKLLISNVHTYKIDITNKDEIFDFIKNLKPDYIIHTAAFTDVDLCEKEKDLSYKINVIGTKNIIESCQKLNSKFVYISTDYVFDGEKGLYDENDKPNPLNYYGYTKLLGEKIVLDYKNSIVIRTTFYGLNPKGNKGGIENLIIKIKNGNKIYASYNTFNSIISINKISELIYEIVEKNFTGIIHIGIDGKISRYDFLLKLSKFFDLDPNLILKIDHDSYYQNKPAKRPKDVSLNINKLKSLLNLKTLNIEEDLIYFKNNIYNYYQYFGGKFEY